jgi:N6-adenosine-specific RNA methylase IME4
VKQKFDIIYCDPPWQYDKPKALIGTGGKGKIANAEQIIQVNVDTKYPTMTIDGIKELPINNLAAKNALLYIWTTNNFIREAYEIIECWGFKPQNFLTYGKVQKTDHSKPSMKTGYWFRSATEHLIFAKRGKVKRPEDFLFPTLFLEERLGHSIKPTSFYGMIEKSFPNGRYLELFARRKEKDNWSYWGNEIENDIDINSYISKE